MDRFVICENIKRFTTLLGAEKDAQRRRQIEALLLEEQVKLDLLDANRAESQSEGKRAADAEERTRNRLTVHARQCRLKAEELRTAAAGMVNSAAVEPMLRLARDYDLLAERAEARLGSVARSKQGAAG
jgi:hypothetical protein